MKAKQVKTLSIEDLKNFIDGTGNWEQTQRELNAVTGFDKTILNLNTIDKYTDVDILESELIEHP